MGKITKYIAVFLLFLIIGTLAAAKPCLAASAEVTISTDKTDVTVGDSVYVYINVSSDTAFGDFETNVIYDDGLLQFDGRTPVITGNSGFLKISDMNEGQGDTSRKYTLEFEALQVGVCEISFSGRAMVYDFDTDQEMSVSSNVLSLNIKAPETASADANLKSLKTSPADITPVFDPGTLEYKVSVGYETEQLVITAIPEDSKASVSITGNDFLKEGENKVVIDVLAESGAVIEYTINVSRGSAPAGQTTDSSVISPDTIKDSFELVDVDGTKYAVFSGKYTITQPDDTVAVPEGYTLGSLTISNITIPAYLPDKNKTSEFILIYAMNEYGDAGFYQYDRIEKTLQRYVPDEIINNSGDKPSLDTMGTTDNNRNLTTAVVVIAILSGFCALMIFITIRMFFKLKGYKEDDFD